MIKAILTLSLTIIHLACYAQQTEIFKDPRDGKVYKTVKIGTQIWFAENLAFKTDSGCWAYDIKDSNVVKYGYLYDWETAKTACPIGWHLPSDAEWAFLVEFFGGDSVAGGKMKATNEWEYPRDGTATNDSGFEALPAGERNNLGLFRYLSSVANFQSSTPYGSRGALCRDLFYGNGKVDRFFGFRTNGYSVRCTKINYPQQTAAFKDPRDDKVYKTVKIGTQTWFAENLAFKVDSGCWAYDNKESNLAKYGYLYNWETAKKACPTGWHLPSDSKWTILVEFLGGDSIAGGKMKAINEWEYPGDGNSTNESGFNALPSGLYSHDKDTCFRLYQTTRFWTNTPANSKFIWLRALYFSSRMITQSRNVGKEGFSIRCTKD